MSRLARLLASPLAALVFAAGASAHGGKSAPGFQSTVSGLDPQVPGLLVEVLRNGELLSVRNLSGREVVFRDRRGAPFLRFTAKAVHRREAGAWQLLKRGTSYAWHDPRIHWTGPVPERSGFVADWQISGTADGAPLTIRGFIGYTAPAAVDTDDGLSPGVVAALAIGGALALAALALPLLRRKGEDESETSEPTGS